MDDIKVVIKVLNDKILVIQGSDRAYPFVVATADYLNVAVGDMDITWSHGHYFKTLEEALAYFNKEKE